MNRDFLKIGHRGACGYEPENTLISFEKAIRLGVDMIELDVHCCKSGELVVIHDETLERTTNGKGPVSEMNWSEIKKLDAGNRERVPLLSEVFDLVDRRVKVNIELKGEGTALPACKLIDSYVTAKGWTYDDFILSSFSHNELYTVRSMNKVLKIGANIEELPFDFTALNKDICLHSVHPSIESLTDDFVEKAHNSGLKVYVWTIVKPEEAQRTLQMGADGIFMNFPDKH